MLFNPRDDNLVELDRLEAQIAVREVLEKTRHCKLIWSKFSSTHYHTIFENYDIHLVQLDSSINMDVARNQQSVFSLTSIQEPSVADLYDVVESYMSDSCDITNELIQNSFRQSERCPFTYWINGKGGVVVGGGTELRNYRCECVDSEICLICDTTGSMGGVIAQIRNVFSELNEMFTSDTCKWAVVSYKDFEDAGDYASGWSIVQEFTSDFDQIQDAITMLIAGGGGDSPEQAFASLKLAADNWVSSLAGRDEPDVKKIIIWAGDVPSWNSGAKGFAYPTRQQVKDALTSKHVRLLALNTGGAGYGLDGGAGADNVPNQASDIVNSVGGQVISNITTYDLEQLREIVCTFVSNVSTPPGGLGGDIGFQELAWDFVIGDVPGYTVLNDIAYHENVTSFDGLRVVFAGCWYNKDPDMPRLLRGTTTPIFPVDLQDDLKTWISSGGRLYIASDPSAAGHATAVNDLLEFIGIGMRLGIEDLDTESCYDGAMGGIEVADSIPFLPHLGTLPIALGASSFAVAYTHGSSVVLDLGDDETPFVAIEKFGNGYVMLCGDAELVGNPNTGCAGAEGETLFRNFYFMEDPIGDTLARETLFPESLVKNEWSATSSVADIDEGVDLVDFSDYIVHIFEHNVDTVTNNFAEFRFNLSNVVGDGPFTKVRVRAFAKMTDNPGFTGSVRLQLMFNYNGTDVISHTYTMQTNWKIYQWDIDYAWPVEYLNNLQIILVASLHDGWGPNPPTPTLRVAAVDVIVF